MPAWCSRSVICGAAPMASRPKPSPRCSGGWPTMWPWPSARAAAARPMSKSKFYDLLTSLRFFPNSPTFTGAGTPLGQLAACFVLKIEDDMGRCGLGHLPDPARRGPHPADRRRQWLWRSRACAPRPRWCRPRPARPPARLASCACTTRPSARSPRAARAAAPIWQSCAAIIRMWKISSPARSNENAITNFNISVGITDAFMRAVQRRRSGICVSRM